MVHPGFPGWVKVGSAVDPKKRLSSYQTGDPNRSYRMLAAIKTLDRRTAEWLAHERLRRLGYLPQGEWFNAAPAFAERILHKAVASADEGNLLR